MTTDVGTVLHHRPFATLLRPTTGAAAVAGSAVRAEIRVLVDQKHSIDATAPTFWPGSDYRCCRTRAVAVSVPVAVTINAPTTGTPATPGSQLVSALGRLHAGYLTGLGAVTAPADDAARPSLQALTCRRAEACPGYPGGGPYRIGADALLAIMVGADSVTCAYAGAKARLSADLARLTGIDVNSARMRRPWTHRFAGLDDRPKSISWASPRGPGTAAREGIFYLRHADPTFIGGSGPRRATSMCARVIVPFGRGRI